MTDTPGTDLTCPSCGRDNFEVERQCVRGYHADESFIVQSFLAESTIKENDQLKEKSINKIAKTKSEKSAEETVIKEIDSWIFSFSDKNKCIYLGTPALQSFRLTLGIEDLEKLLEFIYQKTGQQKTTKRLALTDKAVNELIAKIHKSIKHRLSKMAVEFSHEEVQDIREFINIALRS